MKKKKISKQSSLLLAWSFLDNYSSDIQKLWKKTWIDLLCEKYPRNWTLQVWGFFGRAKQINQVFSAKTPNVNDYKN